MKGIALMTIETEYNPPDLEILVERIAANRNDATVALQHEAEHRTRSSNLLTASVLLVWDLMGRGIDSDDTAYSAIACRLETSGLAPVSGHGEVKLARLCLGPKIDRKRVYRVASAARQLRTVRTNDPAGYLDKNGGVTGCAELWSKRHATRKNEVPGKLPQGSIEWAAGHIGRLVPAVIRIGPAGTLAVVCFRGPKYVLIEVIDQEKFDQHGKRLVTEVSRGDTVPLRLVVRDGHELQTLTVEHTVRIIAQGDDPSSLLLAITNSEMTMDPIQHTTQSFSS
jgi:hypothetical protein